MEFRFPNLVFHSPNVEDTKKAFMNQLHVKGVNQVPGDSVIVARINIFYQLNPDLSLRA